LIRELRFLGFVAHPLVGPPVHAFGPLRNRIGVVAAPTELLLDPGGLLQPARLPSTALASVAEPAALPAAKVDPVGVQLGDAAATAGTDEPQPLPLEPARSLVEPDGFLDVAQLLPDASRSVLQDGLQPKGRGRPREAAPSLLR
jgi:hypothetical protein